MIYRVFSTLVFLLVACSSWAGSVVLEGTYQGKNLYVRNPFAGSGVGFCTYEVTVNGEVTTDEINSSAFEVDFTNFELQVGDAIVVVIKHKDDCTPKVLNPEVLNPQSTFVVESINIDDNGKLVWETTGETGVLPFIVERKVWNKWVYLGEVEGKGVSKSSNSYVFMVTPHSGVNKVRIKQVDYTGIPRYSDVVEFDAGGESIEFWPAKVSDVVNFSAETMFEVYDMHGNIVKKGFGEKIDCTNLKKGLYYLNFDNKTNTFVKKKS